MAVVPAAVLSAGAARLGTAHLDAVRLVALRPGALRLDALRLAAADPGRVPPQPTVARMLLHVSPEAGPLLMVALMAGVYLFGVRRLTQRGDAWSPWRTVSWLTGVVVIGYALVGGVAAYDTTLFSAHAAQHMLLGTVAPLPLALGAPITLALRTLPRRARGVLMVVLHSRVARVLTFPLVGFAIFMASLYGLYFTSLYQASMEHPWLHLAVHVHFIVVGCLFYWPIIGIDPIPGRLPYWSRLILLFITFPIHALWALAMFTTDQVFAQGWYESVGRTWGTSLITDQRTGAGLMWAAGEIVGFLVFVALFVQWSRADDREAVRVDRRLDREERLAALASSSAGPVSSDDLAPADDLARADDLGPADDLEEREAAYNAWLASLAAADAARQRGRG